jgi:ABC-2 type transport system permease protein
LAIFFSIFPWFVPATGGTAATASPDSSIFFIASTIGLFVAYLSDSQVFLVEKRNGVIETLLCAPLSLRQIWLGKVLGVTLVPYVLSLLATSIILVRAILSDNTVLLPSAPVFLHTLLVVPIFVAAFSGLIGFGQLLLGMHENRIVNLVLIIPVLWALYGAWFTASSRHAISWAQVGIIFAISLLLLVATAYLTGYLNKERVVISIPG